MLWRLWEIKKNSEKNGGTMPQENLRGSPQKKLEIFDFEIIDVSYTKFNAESDSVILFELSFV